MHGGPLKPAFAGVDTDSVGVSRSFRVIGLRRHTIMTRRRLTTLRRHERPAAGPDTLVHAGDRELLYALVEDARAGDRAAFRQIFDLCHNPIYRVALARTGSHQDAEDIVAETFLQAWRSLDAFTWTGAPFSAWLATIAHGKAVELFRSRARRPATPVADIAELDRPQQHTLPQEDADRRMEVGRLLSTLSQEQQTVLALRFYGGLSAEEIGEQIGKSSGSVRQIQLKALERLSFTLRQERAA